MAEHSIRRALTRFALVPIGILIALFGAVWILSQVPAVQRELADRLSKMAGPNLGFGRIAPILWPGLGVSVDDVYLDVNPADPEDHVVTVASMDVVLRFSRLLQGEVAVRSLSLTNADVFLERDADGSFPIEGLIDQIVFQEFGGSESEGDKDLSSKSAASNFDVIPAVEIENSTIRFVDHSVGGKKLDIELVDVELHLGASRPGLAAAVQVAMRAKGGGQFSGDGTLTRSAEHLEIEDASFQMKVVGKGLPLRASLLYLLPGDVLAEAGSSLGVTAQVSGDLAGSVKGHVVVKFPAADQVRWLGVDWMGPLHFETGFALRGSRLSLTDSVLKANAIRWEKLRGEELTTRFDLESSAVRFEDAQLRFYGGTIAFSGSIDFRQGTEIDLKTTVTGVDMQSLMEASSGETPEVGFETLGGEFEAAGSIGSGDRRFDGLSGRGSMLLEGGNLPSSSVIGSVGGALTRLIPGFMRPDVSSISPETVIDHLSQSMELRTGVVHVSDLEFVTQDYTMRGTGTIGLDGAVNLHTELDFSIVGMQK
ncbi:MAG: AsmA-like C-terminal region-containing protein, partial [Myxococcota bacterium]